MMIGTREWWGVGVAIVSLTIGATWATVRAHVPPAPAPLPIHGQVPSFALTDQSQEVITREALRGRVWIADFILTRCAGQCPLMSEQMAQLQALTSALPDVRLVSFSVDPAFDTPEVLAAYAARYHAQAGQWSFLTGHAEDIGRLAQEGFRLGLGEGTSAREPIAHSVRFVLVDRAGRIRGYYDATEPNALTALLRDAHRLLSEGS